MTPPPPVQAAPPPPPAPAAPPAPAQGSLDGLDDLDSLDDVPSLAKQSLQPPRHADTGQLDVSQLLEDAEVAVAPGTTTVPPRVLEPEAAPDTIFDVEVVDDEDGHGAAPAPARQPFMAAPGKASAPRPKEASETFMVPQESLEEAPEGLDAGALSASLDGLDDEPLAVDGTDMSDVSDMLDELDDE
jgi:hypothetical protein